MAHPILLLRYHSPLSLSVWLVFIEKHPPLSWKENKLAAIMRIVTESVFTYKSQEKGQLSHISYNEDYMDDGAAFLLALCLSGNSLLRD